MQTGLNPDLRTILVVDGDNFVRFFEDNKRFNIKTVISDLTQNLKMEDKPVIFYSTFKPTWEKFYDTRRTEFPGVEFKDPTIHFKLARERTYSDFEIVMYILGIVHEFDNLIFLASDQDFAPFVNYLQNTLGKHVQLVFNGKINPLLQGVAEITTSLGRFLAEAEIQAFEQKPFKAPVGRPFDIALTFSVDFFGYLQLEKEGIADPAKKEPVLRQSGDPPLAWIVADAFSLAQYFKKIKKTPLEKITAGVKNAKIAGTTFFINRPKEEIMEHWYFNKEFDKRVWSDYKSGLDVKLYTKNKGGNSIDIAVFILEHLDYFDELYLYTDDSRLDDLAGYLAKTYNKKIHLFSVRKLNFERRKNIRNHTLTMPK